MRPGGDVCRSLRRWILFAGRSCGVHGVSRGFRLRGGGPPARALVSPLSVACGACFPYAIARLGKLARARLVSAFDMRLASASSWASYAVALHLHAPGCCFAYVLESLASSHLCSPFGYYSVAGNAACTICPAGSACSSPSAGPVACATGYYSVAGSATCTLCPAGYACSSASALPTAW
jgi:hypothetical protein